MTHPKHCLFSHSESGIFVRRLFDQRKKVLYNLITESVGFGSNSIFL